MRKPLPVDFSKAELEALDPRWRPVVEQLRDLQQRDLGYWESYPINLPPTVFQGEAAPLGQLFQAPTDDELEAVARDADGKLKRLSPAQLDELRQTGQFSVPSGRYPGQNHVWALSALLQQGREPRRARLRAGVAAALRQLIILVPRRLRAERPVSLVHGGKSLLRGLRGALDLVVGLRAMRPRHEEPEIARQLGEARQRFVLDGFQPARPLPPGRTHHPLIWENAEGQRLDLAASAPGLIEQIRPRLDQIFADNQGEWRRESVAVQEAIARRLQGEQVPPDELPERLAREVVSEQQERFFARMLGDPWLASRHPDLGRLLVEHARAYLAVRALEDADASAQQALRARTLEQARREHPTRSLIPEWIEELLATALAPPQQAREATAPARMQAAMEAQNLAQSAFLFARGAAFRAEIEPGLRRALESEEQPAQTFLWARRLRDPKRWTIVRHAPTREGSDAGGVWYSAIEEETSRVATDRAFWRLRQAFFRAYSFLHNGTIWLVQENVWSGRLGLRALFGAEPFSPRMEVDRKTGAIVPSKERIPTYRSRLRALWAGVRASRQAFEAKPDTGFVGKAFSRWINRLWNHVIKGAVGTLLIAVFQPLFTGVNLLGSTLLALTSVVWAPLASVVVWLGQMLLVDRARAGRGRRYFPLSGYLLIDIGLKGVGQVALALGLAGAAHPIAAALIVAASGLRAAARSLYDELLFAVVIRRLGRVPARDGFLARRVEGPGVSASFYYQVSPGLVLLVLQATMEQEEIRIYQEKTEAEIRGPERDLARFTAEVLGAFADSPSPSDRSRKLVEQTTARHLDALQQALAPRHELLGTLTDLGDPGRIRQTRRDLGDTVEQAIPRVRAFYEERILPRLTPDEGELLWADRGLRRGDFRGLTLRLLEGAFSPALLSPLEDTDRALRLVVDHLDLHDYLRALEEGSPIGDDLDLVREPDHAGPLATVTRAPLDPASLFDPQPAGLAELLQVPPPRVDRVKERVPAAPGEGVPSAA